MFTGIIEQIGVVASFIRTQNSAKLVVSAGKYFDDLKPGESVAVNGACLTATQSRRGFAEFDVSPETLKRSSLVDLKISDKVNLEKALPVSGRLGGHLVTGHIDGTAEIRSKNKNGEGFDLWLSIPSEMLRYLVAKGSVAIDGASLTVADFRDSLLRVTVIPHTAKTTTLGGKSIGDRVNLEVDLISKYIEKHLTGEPRGVSDEMMMRLGIMPMGWTDN
ncbi:MAG: riboflavin synthase [Candidatus Margulisiibacteriota bacterium]